MTTAEDTPQKRLWTYEFTVLTVVTALGFCNIAVFYGFSSYLERIGMPPVWRGPLLAAEPLAACLARPFLSVLATPGNALALARWSLVAMGAALCCYQFASGLPALLTVRFLHGLSFVCLVSATMTLLTTIIPKSLSGRAFGYFSLSALVPYATMPPLMEWLLPRVGNEARAYAITAWLVVPALALFVPLGRHLKRQPLAGVAGFGRPSLTEIRENLRQWPVLLLLAANLGVTTSTTLVFFFVKPFALGIGVTDPGLFFTISTVTSIMVRIVVGPYYDQWPKRALLLVGLIGLGGCMLIFSGTTDETRCLLVAAAYGLCLGVVMPLLNAAMFLESPPHLRGCNMNLMLLMMDVGYVVGPVTGGAILAANAGYPTLFTVCAAVAVTAAAFVFPLSFREWRETRAKRAFAL